MSSLAAARADNFYYPPEWTPDQGGINKFQGQHPLRARARKLNEGVLIIRFEMPFNIWCGKCGEMIAKGVRFNAEKKHIGNYLSTKIWSFKMKAACCQNEIEIQTDPQNCDYVVAKGAEKKAVEYSAEDAEALLLPDRDERQKLSDPLYRLEHVNADKAKAKESHPILIGLKKISDARHSNPYRQNRTLRDRLRKQKKRVLEEEKHASRLGLGIRLLPASEEDAKIANGVNFRPKFETNLCDKRTCIQASSIFSQTASKPASEQSKRNHELANCLSSGNGDKVRLLQKRNHMNLPEAHKLLMGNFAASAATKKMAEKNTHSKNGGLSSQIRIKSSNSA